MSRICLNEYTSVFRQAGRLIFCSTFACLPLREFSHGFKSFRFCYEQRNARVNFTKNLYGYADFEYVTGGEIKTPYRWNAGVRYAF